MEEYYNLLQKKRAHSSGEADNSEQKSRRLDDGPHSQTHNSREARYRSECRTADQRKDPQRERGKHCEERSQTNERKKLEEKESRQQSLSQRQSKDKKKEKKKKKEKIPKQTMNSSQIQPAKGRKAIIVTKERKVAPDITASTIVQWNINGIKNNKKEIVELIKTKKASIVALQETLIDSKFLHKIDGFNVMAKNGSNSNGRFHGGVAT